MNKMIIFVINDVIYDLENTELNDKEEDKDFQKDVKELIEILETYKTTIRD